MKNFVLKARRFLVSEDGPTAVEYAVMLALIVIVCLTAITSIGTKANTTFTNVAASLGSLYFAPGAAAQARFSDLRAAPPDGRNPSFG